MNEWIASMKNDQLHFQDANKEQNQITRFVDDVVPEQYVKPGVSSNQAWISNASEAMEHTIKDILARPVNVLDSEWTVGSTASTTLAFPDVLLQNSNNLVDKLNRFEFLRADVKVKILFNATPFMQGRFWAFFSPYDTLCNRGVTGTLQNATGYPGVEIDIANGAPVELTIPYCSPLSHYRLSNGESTMGDLVIRPIVPLDSGDTGNSAPFSVLAWFENIDLTMPTNQIVNVPLLEAQGEEMEENKDCMISPTVNQVANVAASAGEIPLLSQLAKPVEWVARAASGVLSTFGLNKPRNLHETATYANIPGKGYTNMDGLDNSVVLGAAPDNKLTEQEGIFSSKYDEMDLDFVKKKSCIVKDIITWSTTGQPSGTQLYYFQNSPSCLDTGTNRLDPTTLCFLSTMFRYWRGGIKYRLTATKTAFHSGRLRIGFIPAGGPQTPLGSLNLQFTHNWILDLSKSSEIEFEVPYVSNRPWTEVIPAGRQLPAVWSSTRRTGTLVFEVLTPLRAASTSVSQEVQLTLWHSGADDLEFAIPEFANTRVADDTVPFLEEEEEVEEERPILEAQIFNATDEAIEHREQEINSSTPMFDTSRQGYTMPEELSIGEKITSLRQLVKRFGTSYKGLSAPYVRANDPTQANLIGPFPIGAAGADSTAIAGINIDPAYFGEKGIGSVSNPVLQTQNLAQSIDYVGNSIATSPCFVGEKLPPTAPIDYISYLYRFYRGSKRYKFMFPADGNTGSAAQQIGNNQAQFISMNYDRPRKPVVVKRDRQVLENGTIFGVQFLTQSQLAFTTGFDRQPTFEHLQYPDLNGVVEVEVPYYSPLPISLVCEGNLDSSKGALVSRTRVNVFTGPTVESINKPTCRFDGTEAFPVVNRFTADSLGATRVMVAGGDDFSFGYLVGAPKIIRFLTP